MGVIDKAKRTEREKGPECPLIFTSTFEKYRAIRFAERESESSVVLVDRGQIKFTDLSAFRDVSGYDLTYLDVEVIMGIDAIFEGRDNG